MSADAKVWPDDGEGWFWKGIHDGPCLRDGHNDGDALNHILADIEACMRHPLRWEIRPYPDGTFGLVGFRA